MGLSKTIWSKPAEYLARHAPQEPVIFFAPGVLQDEARRFIDGFPGLVTYAVSANPMEMIVENLAAAGLRGYSPASLAEARMLRRLAPEAALHFSAPLPARADLNAAEALGVKSWTIESQADLALLAELMPAAGREISVKFSVADPGSEALAAALLRQAASLGFTPALSLDPGSKATDEGLWEACLFTAKAISEAAGVALARLHVGGSFPAHRVPEGEVSARTVFAAIAAASQAAFGESGPPLVCAPGQAMVAGCLTLATPAPDKNGDIAEGYLLTHGAGACAAAGALAYNGAVQTVLSLR